MYKVINRPILPKLEFIENIKIKNKEEPVSLYRLDWTYKEEMMGKEHLEWLMKHWPENKRIYIEQFPTTYRKWLDEKVYAIPSSYLREIHRESELGMTEWNRSRGFDTVVREACLNPAIAHFRTAFYLISDCCYDLKSKGWERNRAILLPALLYRFWIGETGRGLVRYHAELSELEKKIDLVGIDEENRENIKRFLDAINEVEEEIEKQFEFMVVDMGKNGELPKVDVDSPIFVPLRKMSGKPKVRR
jgi:hypothetical protein